MNIIKIYKPHDMDPNRKPEWNTGLYAVEYQGKEYHFWSRRNAVDKVASFSTGKEIIIDYTNNTDI